MSKGKEKKTKKVKSQAKKSFKSENCRAVVSIFAHIFFLCCLTTLIFGIVFSYNMKKDGPTGTDMFGTHLVIAQDNSMRDTTETIVAKFDVKSINMYSMVFVDKVPEKEEDAAAFYKDIKVGDVVTYTFKGKVYSHRVFAVDGDKIIVKADTAKETNVREINIASKQIIGKVTGQSYFLGLLTTSVMKPLGYICIFIFPCLILVIYEALKFAKMKNLKEQDQVADADILRLELIKDELAKQNAENDKKKDKLWIG